MIDGQTELKKNNIVHTVVIVHNASIFFVGDGRFYV